MALPGLGSIFPKPCFEYEQRKLRIMCGHKDREEIVIRLHEDNKTVFVSATSCEGRNQYRAEMHVDEFERRFLEFVINAVQSVESEPTEGQ